MTKATEFQCSECQLIKITTGLVHYDLFCDFCEFERTSDFLTTEQSEVVLFFWLVQLIRKVLKVFAFKCNQMIKTQSPGPQWEVSPLHGSSLAGLIWFNAVSAQQFM